MLLEIHKVFDIVIERGQHKFGRLKTFNRYGRQILSTLMSAKSWWGFFLFFLIFDMCKVYLIVPNSHVQPTKNSKFPKATTERKLKITKKDWISSLEIILTHHHRPPLWYIFRDELNISSWIRTSDLQLWFYKSINIYLAKADPCPGLAKCLICFRVQNVTLLDQFTTGIYVVLIEACAPWVGK